MEENKLQMETFAKFSKKEITFVSILFRIVYDLRISEEMTLTNQ